MKRWLFAAILGFAALFATHAKAEAATCTVTFTDGAVLHAIQLTNMVSCINNIDRANINASGIDASQIKPISLAAAIFGGAYTYEFPNGVLVDAAAPTPAPGPTGGTIGPALVAQPTASPYYQPGTLGTQNVAILSVDPSPNPQYPPLRIMSPYGNAVLGIGYGGTAVPGAATWGGVLLFGSGNAGFTGTGSPNTVAKIGTGGAGVTNGSMGGYLYISTKADASTSLAEGFVMDNNAHVELPRTVITVSTTTPSSCSALVQCGTVTYTFPHSFVSLTNAPQVPTCTGLTTQDTTTPTDTWIASINAVSASSVTFNYAAMVATVAAKGLTLNFACWQNNY